MVILTLQNPAPNFSFPGLVQVNDRTFELQEEHLFQIRVAIDLEDDSDRIRQMKGALKKALQDNGGWDYTPSGYRDRFVTRARDGQPYHNPDVRFIRMVWKGNNYSITHVECLDQSGQEILAFQMPSGATPGVWLIKKLNEMGNTGWVFKDTSDWSSMDHLFSHGH